MGKRRGGAASRAPGSLERPVHRSGRAGVPEGRQSPPATGDCHRNGIRAPLTHGAPQHSSIQEQGRKSTDVFEKLTEQDKLDAGGLSRPWAAVETRPDAGPCRPGWGPQGTLPGGQERVCVEEGGPVLHSVSRGRGGASVSPGLAGPTCEPSAKMGRGGHSDSWCPGGGRFPEGRRVEMLPLGVEELHRTPGWAPL